MSVFDNPNVSLRPLSIRNRANIRTSLTFLETRIRLNHWPTFCRFLIVWVYLHSSSFLVGFVRRFFPQECILAVRRGHPVIDFGTDLKCVCDFLLVRHSNLGPILHRFGDIAGFCVHDTPLFFAGVSIG